MNTASFMSAVMPNLNRATGEQWSNRSISATCVISVLMCKHKLHKPCDVLCRYHCMVPLPCNKYALRARLGCFLPRIAVHQQHESVPYSPSAFVTQLSTIEG